MLETIDLGGGTQTKMMSPNEHIQTSKDNENLQNSSTNSKTATTRPLEQALKCPRCDSLNTKFCYYNNYSLTQPRHFCKTCRRYWTKGGALRNVPNGGGCRKNKKVLKSSSSTSSSDFGRLKFFNVISNPAVDFQSLPTTSVYGPLRNLSLCPSGTSNLMGLNNNNNNELASSIESLSCINQDLHWKLQQQRLAMLFGTTGLNLEPQKSESPFLFQNLQEFSKSDFEGSNIMRKVSTGETATEWYFGNSYAVPQSVTPTPANSNGNENVSSWDKGGQAWSDLQLHHQFTALP